MLYLDRPKARALVEDELQMEQVARGRLVLAGDEWWNSETIYEEGKFVTQEDFRCYFAGTWAIPIFVIEYQDGKEKRVSCYFDERDDPTRAKDIETTEREKADKMFSAFRNKQT